MGHGYFNSVLGAYYLHLYFRPLVMDRAHGIEITLDNVDGSLNS
jgi:hypothetical protein